MYLWMDDCLELSDYIMVGDNLTDYVSVILIEIVFSFNTNLEQINLSNQIV